MNTVIPVLIRERAVFYRERFSNMYPAEVHAIAFALGEIPWLTLEIFLVVPCLCAPSLPSHRDLIAITQTFLPQ